MHFLRVNVTYHDTVRMIHDVITTANSFEYTVKFIFVGDRNNKTQQIKTRKLSILPTCLILFDIGQHDIRIPFIIYIKCLSTKPHCSVRDREVERRPHNHRVSSSIP